MNDATTASVVLLDLRISGLPPGLASHRGRLLLTLGFASGFLRSELAGITVDVEQVAEVLLVHLERSKTRKASGHRT
jgi:site-specific recombinase XerD